MEQSKDNKNILLIRIHLSIVLDHLHAVFVVELLHNVAIVCHIKKRIQVLNFTFNNLKHVYLWSYIYSGQVVLLPAMLQAVSQKELFKESHENPSKRFFRTIND